MAASPIGTVLGGFLHGNANTIPGYGACVVDVGAEVWLPYVQAVQLGYTGYTMGVCVNPANAPGSPMQVLVEGTIPSQMYNLGAGPATSVVAGVMAARGNAGATIGTCDVAGLVTIWPSLSGQGAVAPPLILGGDVIGAANANTVVGLQSRPVAPTAPAVGQVLTWSGAAWQPGSSLPQRATGNFPQAGGDYAVRSPGGVVGTIGVTNGSTAVTFSSPQTLNKGDILIVVDGFGTYCPYQLAANIVAANAGVLTWPYQGGNAATATWFKISGGTGGGALMSPGDLQLTGLPAGGWVVNVSGRILVKSATVGQRRFYAFVGDATNLVYPLFTLDAEYFGRNGTDIPATGAGSWFVTVPFNFDCQPVSGNPTTFSPVVYVYSTGSPTQNGTDNDGDLLVPHASCFVTATRVA